MTAQESLSEAERVYIGMGSNAGDRLTNLREATRRLSDTHAVRLCEVSGVYETEAHVLPGQEVQPDHFNAVVLIKTTLAPGRLLDKLKELEQIAGRDPAGARWAPRPLDLDILVFGNRILSTDDLEIPHPRIAERRFVLEPFCDLAPDLTLPNTTQTIRHRLAACADTARVVRTDHILA